MRDDIYIYVTTSTTRRKIFKLNLTTSELNHTNPYEEDKFFATSKGLFFKNPSGDLERFYSILDKSFNVLYTIRGYSQGDKNYVILRDRIGSKKVKSIVEVDSDYWSQF